LKPAPHFEAPGGTPLEGEADGREIETRVQSAAAIETEFRIELVKIMHDAADRRTLVIVELLIKNAKGDGAAVGHEIFADVAAGVREARGKLIGSGEQQQARSFGAVGGKNHGFGFLQMNIALAVEIEGADCAAVLVSLDAMDVAVRANFAAAGFFRPSE